MLYVIDVYSHPTVDYAVVKQIYGRSCWRLGWLVGGFVGKLVVWVVGGWVGCWQALVAMSWDLEDLGTYAGVGFVSPGGLI